MSGELAHGAEFSNSIHSFSNTNGQWAMGNGNRVVYKKGAFVVKNNVQGW